MAILDCIHAMSLMLGTGVLPAPIAILLPQTLIPFTYMIQRCWNGDTGSGNVRQSSMYVGGAIAMAMGVLIATIMMIMGYEKCDDTCHSRSEITGNHFHHMTCRVTPLSILSCVQFDCCE